MNLTGRLVLQKFGHIKKGLLVYNVRYQTTMELIEDTSEELLHAKPFEEIPSDFSLPIFGTAWTYFPYIGKYDSRKMHEASIARYKKFGPIIRETLMGSCKAVSIYDPADMEKVFRHEGKYPFRPGMEFLLAYRNMRPEWYKSTGLVALNGKEWKEFRAKFQHWTMRPQYVQTYLEPMEEVTEDMIKRMRRIRNKDGEVPNFNLELCKWALEALCAMVLDKRLGCLDEHLSPDSKSIKMIEAAIGTFEGMNNLMFSPFNFWKYIPTKNWRRFVESQDKFASIAIEEVEEAIEIIEKGTECVERPSFIQNLLANKDVDPREIVSFVSDMLLGGIDTTSHSAAFTLYFLAKHAECQEKAFSEINLKVPKNDPLTPKILNEIPYVKACIKESMRMLPVVSGILRTLDHDIILSGYRIPRGVAIRFQNFAACRQEDYLPQADKYIPERWLKEKKEHHPYLVLPFGMNKRMCIGKRIADQELLLIIIKIIQNFRLEYHDEDIDCYTRVVNVPDKPLKFKFIDRET